MVAVGEERRGAVSEIGGAGACWCGRSFEGAVVGEDGESEAMQTSCEVFLYACVFVVVRFSKFEQAVKAFPG